MNKILISLVLALGITGTAHAGGSQFLTATAVKLAVLKGPAVAKAADDKAQEIRQTLPEAPRQSKLTQQTGKTNS